MATKAPQRLQAREPIVIVVDARPIKYEQRIVKDRRSGRLAEIDMHELPPVDPGTEGMSYAFRSGEKVWSDHPAVAACPNAFIPAVDD
jgi:hypothetical protein